jgi:hypothetical protein
MVGSITVTTIMFDSTLVLRTPHTNVTYFQSRLVAVHLSALYLIVGDDLVGKEGVKYAASAIAREIHAGIWHGESG